MPWWISRAASLMAPLEVKYLTLGELWHLREQLQFIRDNVEPALLAQDVRVVPGALEAWGAFEEREGQVHAFHAESGASCARSISDGTLGPVAFRASWETLGFARHGDSAGTPADDYLDGLYQLSRLADFVTPGQWGLLNLATRAARVADFLAVVEPKASDVVFDLGSGSGKLANTVAASTQSQVRGIELEPTYASQARQSATWLGLRNVSFETADVRDVDLTPGSVFYLYYPFHGEVARHVSTRLGALARQKDIVVYAAGPTLDYGEHFLAQVGTKALRLAARRGEFGEVLHLVSQRG
jgi:predicted RNA methylase